MRSIEIKSERQRNGRETETETDCPGATQLWGWVRVYMCVSSSHSQPWMWFSIPEPPAPTEACILLPLCLSTTSLGCPSLRWSFLSWTLPSNKPELSGQRGDSAPSQDSLPWLQGENLAPRPLCPLDLELDLKIHWPDIPWRKEKLGIGREAGGWLGWPSKVCPLPSPLPNSGPLPHRISC